MTNKWELINEKGEHVDDEERKAIRDALAKPFPKEAIKRRSGGGGKKFDYIETHTVIRRLNDATNSQWDFEIVDTTWFPDKITVVGRLTIPGMGSRDGTGVQEIRENAGVDLIKGAASDALKKAATLFEVALDLYGDNYESPKMQMNQSRKRLGQLLIKNAVKTKAQADEGARQQFGVSYNELTDEQVQAWVELLERAETPPVTF